MKETATRHRIPTSGVATCALCDLAASAPAKRRRAPNATPLHEGVVGFPVDGSFIVVMDEGCLGAFVAPLEHVGELSSLAAEAAGSFLAGLRRAALVLQSLCGASGITVSLIQGEGDEMSWLNHHGHILFNLLPTEPVLGAAPSLSTATVRDQELTSRIQSVFNALRSA
jgi:hypothetical protein